MSSSNFLRTLVTAISRRNSVGYCRNVSTVCFLNKNNYVVYHTLNPNLQVHYRMMASASAIRNIGIDGLKQYQKNKSATIIDVREDAEIKETGLLPGAIHIPLAKVEEALQINPEMFENQYKQTKPSLDSPVLFSCRSGKRSMMAAKKAEALGYKNVMNFEGGWLEWESNLPK